MSTPFCCHPLSFALNCFGVLISWFLSLWHWLGRKCCPCLQTDESKIGGRYTRGLLVTNLDKPLLLHTSPEGKENVSTEEFPLDCETSSLDRQFLPNSQEKERAIAYTKQCVAGSSNALFYSCFHRQFVSSSISSPSQRLKNFFSHRLKRAKSFPKLIRRRDVEQQQQQLNANEDGSIDQLMKIMDERTISIRHRMNPDMDRIHRMSTELNVWILEAKGISSKRRFYCELSLDGRLLARTSTKGLNDGTCFWGESFEFGSLPPTRQLCIDLFRDEPSKIISRRGRTGRTETGADRLNTLIGLVQIPLEEITSRQPLEKWYLVNSGDLNNKNSNSTIANTSCGHSQPSIRIKARYISVHILPLHAYRPLREFLCYHFLPLCLTFESILKEAKAKEDFSSTLVRILQREQRADEALSNLTMIEVENQENDHLLFRGNSLASKAIEAYQKLVGGDYLQRTLGPFVRDLLASNLNCEVDPLRLSSSSSLERNRRHLTKKVEEAWSNIRRSAAYFPHPLRLLFHRIRYQFELNSRSELIDNLLSSSLFLRFICPAILSPSLFGLVSEYPPPNHSRNLTLIAKTLQTLANFTLFRGKESYMEFMNVFVEREWRNMHIFLRKISTPEPAIPTDEDHLRAINAGIDFGKELSLLHSYLSELSGPKLAETDNSPNKNLSLGTELQKMLLVMDREKVEQRHNLSLGTACSTPSDYENNVTTICYGDNNNSPIGKRSFTQQHVILPPYPTSYNQQQLLPSLNSTTSVGVPTIWTTDDYVLSTALSELNLHHYEIPADNSMPHLYDEVAVEQHLHSEKTPIEIITMKPAISAATMLNTSIKHTANGFADRHGNLCIPKIVQKGKTDEVDDVQEETDDSSGEGEEIFRDLQHVQQRNMSPGKGLAASIPICARAQNHFNGSHDSSTKYNRNRPWISDGSSGYQSQMNSNSYSSNSSSPVDTTDSSSTTGNNHSELLVANRPSNETKLDHLLAQRKWEHQLQKSKKKNPSCWSIPCTSTAVFVGDPLSPFVRHPQKAPINGTDPKTQSACLAQQLNDSVKGCGDYRQLFSTTSFDMANRNQHNHHNNREIDTKHQEELLEARRKIEELQKQNKELERELDRLKSQSQGSEPVMGPETI